MSEVAKTIIAAKESKGMTWEEIGKAVGMSPVWTTSACMGMNSMPKESADALCEVLGLGPEISTELQKYPTKIWDQAVPTDPLIYRLYEIVGVYGETLKEVIQEKFGDGIMSAIDFSMEVDKEENPKGDRVVITMNGKFLPYKAW
ncbi:MAG: cyanase [Pseudomonadales bacterium]|jgi:cyanate lyase|uniref:cyanase n=1 Tax=unclassified Ketobacter TaxID=2639109 RepID=UPI000C954076|nr:MULTISPECIES: cyanase [unclassified Ketobacter]MAA60452.1 cyanase [Pseudomonadales bacterium]MEC8811610.1 cyanase [Pseudomonadota bacterium]TNC90298.1 MAG: cyanase [Alcanivorax sp.]HAG94590.1 cyanase [Gammaproteobacteria bacterium]MAQ24868.1 cyanase [Pseudomonadales bacterium]|tara:strand:- start:3306 stop:3740 length:435 start_codon:yes stop_codon:yes gene_type:complete